MRVLDNIELFAGLGNESNVYLVDGELLVDTGSGMFFDDVKKKIEKCFDIAMIMRVVNTHAHFDNTGANKKFRDWLGCEIMVHKDDVNAIHAGNVLAEYFRGAPKSVTVDKMLSEGDLIKTDNFRFEVLSAPGHTPGSICLYDKNSRIMFTGDTVFDEFVGRTDLPFGNQEQLKCSLLELSEYPVKYLLPGHGQPKIDGVSFMLKRLAYSGRATKFI